ncbi:hypothetical protein KPH14_007018 [Odynerus spinipes]|uniref:C2H2-type domain-containing protein n=1 Tax=Odynerus spinipes TaxID=1348599 RepID=A0AAD9RSZ2_9HYME|nr:hypothetical protein KPH14_007018 [Odynerus spinipes]
MVNQKTSKKKPIDQQTNYLSLKGANLIIIPGTAGTCKKEKDLSKDGQTKLEHSNVSTECCKLCGKSVANIKKHMKSHFPDKYQCQICMISLTRSDNLKRHIKLKHGIREGSLISPFMRLEPKHFLAKSESAYLT